MAGSTKLMTASGGGVVLTPAANTASDVTVQVPASNCTLLTNKTAGTVLQVVQSSYATETSTTSSSWTTTNLTGTITPTSSTSKILAMVSMQIQGQSSTICAVTLFRGTTGGTNLSSSTTYGFGYQYNNSVDLGTHVAFNYLDSPSTTSAQTYTVAFKSTNNSTIVYSSVSNTLSTLTLIEVAA